MQAHVFRVGYDQPILEKSKGPIWHASHDKELLNMEDTVFMQ